MSPTDDMLIAIVQALNMPSNYELHLDDKISSVPGWDSFGWVAVISALEKYCESELLIEQIDAVRSVRDLVRLVDSLKHF